MQNLKIKLREGIKLKGHEYEFFQFENGAKVVVGESGMRLIYSVEKCIDILVENDEMLLEQAMDYFDFNVRGSYVGEQTPIFCEDIF